MKSVLEVMPVEHKQGGERIGRESLQTIVHIWEAELAEFQAVTYSWRSLRQPSENSRAKIAC